MVNQDDPMQYMFHQKNIYSQKYLNKNENDGILTSSYYLIERIQKMINKPKKHHRSMGHELKPCEIEEIEKLFNKEKFKITIQNK